MEKKQRVGRGLAMIYTCETRKKEAGEKRVDVLK